MNQEKLKVYDLINLFIADIYDRMEREWQEPFKADSVKPLTPMETEQLIQKYMSMASLNSENNEIALITSNKSNKGEIKSFSFFALFVGSQKNEFLKIKGFKTFEELKDYAEKKLKKGDDLLSLYVKCFNKYKKAPFKFSIANEVGLKTDVLGLDIFNLDLTSLVPVLEVPDLIEFRLKVIERKDNTTYKFNAALSHYQAVEATPLWNSFFDWDEIIGKESYVYELAPSLNLIASAMHKILWVDPWTSDSFAKIGYLTYEGVTYFVQGLEIPTEMGEFQIFGSKGNLLTLKFYLETKKEIR